MQEEIKVITILKLQTSTETSFLPLEFEISLQDLSYQLLPMHLQADCVWGFPDSSATNQTQHVSMIVHHEDGCVWTLWACPLVHPAECQAYPIQLRWEALQAPWQTGPGPITKEKIYTRRISYKMCIHAYFNSVTWSHDRRVSFAHQIQIIRRFIWSNPNP